MYVILWVFIFLFLYERRVLCRVVISELKELIVWYMENKLVLNENMGILSVGLEGFVGIGLMFVLIFGCCSVEFWGLWV